MLLDPADLKADLDTLEGIEKASDEACPYTSDRRFPRRRSPIFNRERDLPQDFAEWHHAGSAGPDGRVENPQRLYGKIDYSRALRVPSRYALRRHYSLIPRRKNQRRSNRSYRLHKHRPRILQIRQMEAVDVPHAPLASNSPEVRRASGPTTLCEVQRPKEIVRKQGIGFDTVATSLTHSGKSATDFSASPRSGDQAAMPHRWERLRTLFAC